MGGGGDSQVVGYRYYMDILFGLSRGPIDEVVQVKAGDLRFFPAKEGTLDDQGGVLTAEGPGNRGVVLRENGTGFYTSLENVNTMPIPQRREIEAYDLFGGDNKEGGIQGHMQGAFGDSGQMVSPEMTDLIGYPGLQMKGTMTVFFTGIVTALNPYPKKWAFRVRRVMRGWEGGTWQPSLATIWLEGGIIKAMNPAHILYEALVNKSWGRGIDRSWIKDDVWISAAQTLLNESFGLCIRYTRQASLGEFIQQILDHIGGAIYTDRSTGLLCLALIRDNYDVETLATFTPDSGLVSVEEDETLSSNDIVNEVVVNWYSPLDGKQRQARVQNLASMQEQGALNTSVIEYKGIPTMDLALRVAQRDLRAASASVKRYKVVLDRRAWRIIPTFVFRISAPKLGINNVILRAGKITEEDSEKGLITVEAVVDVFGMPSTSYVTPEGGGWKPPDTSAQIAGVRIIREATYVDMVKRLDPANLDILPVDSGALAALVARPSGLSLGYDIRVAVPGQPAPNTGRGQFAGYVISTNAISYYDTTINFTTNSQYDRMTVGDMVQVGEEICRLTAKSYNASTQQGTLRIARGCVDTIPQEHPAGLTIMVFDVEVGTDSVEYVRGETLGVKVMPYTSSSKLNPDLAATDTVDIVGRQGRPYPPGNVKVNDIPFGNVLDLEEEPVITWTHRDRVGQSDRIVEHTAASIGPEQGVTYTVIVYDSATMSQIRRTDNITGTVFAYTDEMAREDGLSGSAIFELFSVRGGIESYQKYNIGFSYDPGAAGYGNDYGLSYGL